MLNKKFRLKNKKAIDATYNFHKVVSSDLLILYVGKKKNNNEIDTKFAFVVSKKYHKRAVKRNRIKRLIRESVRLILKNNEHTQINNYLSFIFIPKNEALNKSFKEIEASVNYLLSKAVTKF